MISKQIMAAEFLATFNESCKPLIKNFLQIVSPCDIQLHAWSIEKINYYYMHGDAKMFLVLNLWLHLAGKK